MFIIGIALVSGVIAALVVSISGLLAGARYGTVFFRALLGFLAAGGLVSIGAFLLEHYGFPVLSKKTKANLEKVVEIQSEDEEEPSVDFSGGEESADVEEDTVEKEDNAGKAQDFRPLSADGLKHVSVPQD